MHTIYRFSCLLLCLALVSCEPSTPILKQITAPTITTRAPTQVRTPVKGVIISENAHELVQLDFRNENGSKADISVPKDIMVTSVAFSPNGEILAAGYGVYTTNEPSVFLYDMATGKRLEEFKTQFGFVHRVVFSPDGKLIAAGGGFDPGKRGVQVWDIATQAQVLELDDFGDIVFDIAFSPDGAILATAEIGSWFGPGYVKMWSVTKGELLSKFPSDQDPNISGYGVDFNPDGTLLATSLGLGSSGQVVIWDGANPKGYKVFSNFKCDHQRLGVAFSPDGKLVASCGVFNVVNGELLFELGGGETTDFSVIPNVAFCPNGKVIASAINGRVQLWDVNTGNKLTALPGDKSVVFSPDGRLLATGGDAVRLWGIPAR